MAYKIDIYGQKDGRGTRHVWYRDVDGEDAGAFNQDEHFVENCPAGWHGLLWIIKTGNDVLLDIGWRRAVRDAESGALLSAVNDSGQNLLVNSDPPNPYAVFNNHVTAGGYLFNAIRPNIITASSSSPSIGDLCMILSPGSVGHSSFQYGLRP